MKQINLLPQAVRQRAAQRQVAPFIVLAIVVAVVGVGASWFLLSKEVDSLENQVASKKAAEQAEAARLAKEQKSLEVDSDLLARVAQINQLSSAEVNWTKAFTLVGTLLPDDVTLTGFTYTTGQASPILQLKGQAASNLSFAVFVESLRASKQLQTVKVDGFTYDASKGTVAFTLSAVIAPKVISYESL